MLARAEIRVSAHELQRRFQRRAMAYDQVDRLARAIAGGIGLNWWELGADSQATLRADARELLARYGNGYA